MITQPGSMERIHIISSGNGRPGDTHLTLSNGTLLGSVQAITWSMAIGDLGARCIIETICTTVELNALLKDTEVHVKVVPELTMPQSPIYETIPHSLPTGVQS